MAKLPGSSFDLLRFAMFRSPTTSLWNREPAPPDYFDLLPRCSRRPDHLPLVQISLLVISRQLLPRLLIVLRPGDYHRKHAGFLALLTRSRFELLAPCSHDRRSRCSALFSLARDSNADRRRATTSCHHPPALLRLSLSRRSVHEKTKAGGVAYLQRSDCRVDPIRSQHSFKSQNRQQAGIDGKGG